MELKEMKPVGFIRRIGREGRVGLSSKVRKAMDLNENDLVEQFLYKQKNGEYVVLIRKYKGD